MAFFKSLLLIGLLASSATSQFATSATTSASRQQLGLSTVSSHEKTVDDGLSHVHSHGTHVSNPTTLLVRRGRPIVRQTVAHHAVGAPNFVRVASAGQPALHFATHQSAAPSFVRVASQAAPQLFQTADGRFFAFNNGAGQSQLQPGQIFQSADGRLFTIPVAEPAATNAAEAANVNEESFDIAEAARNAERLVAEEEEKKKEEEEEEKEVVEEEVVEKEEEEEKEAEESNNMPAATRNSNSNSNNNQIFLSAPFTANNARFIASPAPIRTQVIHNHPSLLASHPAFQRQAIHHHAVATPTVVRNNFVAAAPAVHHAVATPTLVRNNIVAAAPGTSHAVHHAVATPTVVRNNIVAAAPATHAVHHAVATPTATVVRNVAGAAPVGYSLADSVSSGYFLYSNAGIAYEF